MHVVWHSDGLKICRKKQARHGEVDEKDAKAAKGGPNLIQQTYLIR
jgi:hypothetical protein